MDVFLDKNRVQKMSDLIRQRLKSNDSYSILQLPNQIKNALVSEDELYRQIITREYTTSELTLPDGVTRIRDYLFCQCENIISVDIPNSVTEIGHEAFEGCISLQNIYIPNGVTFIDNYAFKDCTSLTSITIPDSVTYIGMEAFDGCSALRSVKLSNKIETLNSWTFGDCTSLTSITIPDSVTTMYTPFGGCTNLTTINVPWSEGEVAGAPWGATNATINYNYVGE